MFFFPRSMITLIIFLVIATIIYMRCIGISPYAAISTSVKRKTSIDYGNGECEWTPALLDVPEDTSFYKTLVAGYPSGDKRTTFVQMEALSGLSSRDEWDMEYLGLTNHPFVKANYPHHEGSDGWAGAQLGQVALVVRNIKRSMVEYHDILWDIGYAQTYEAASELMNELYRERPPVSDFIKWRNLRIYDEIHWYSWFIDYYMEGGLLRDMFTHERTTPEHWYMLILPHHYTKEELRYTHYIDDPTTVPPAYDPVCMTIDSGCYPVQIISGEKLTDLVAGPVEGRKIAELIRGKEGFDEWMIDEDAWECIWNELIIKKKGLKTYLDRKGIEERDYTFTFEMENEMWYELERLITKYDGQADEVAEDLVALLREHQQLLGITPDPSKRLTYEELMTYHLAFPPFFPHQKPLTHHTDPYFPHQKPFNVSGDYRRMLNNMDMMGPRIGPEYEMRNENKGDVLLNGEDREEVLFDYKMDIDAHFKRADEILRQRRFDQMNSMKSLYGV